MKRVLPLLFVLAVGAQAQAPQRAVGVVSGRVVLPDGAPAARTRVAVVTADSADRPAAVVGVGQTDGAGNYLVDGLAPGRYYITAGSLEWPAYYPGVADQKAATIVTVGSTLALTGLNFTLVQPAGAAVRGRVTGVPQGIPASSFRVLLIHDGGAASQPSRQAPVDDNGAFRFDKVMPGSYRVRAYVEEPGADLSVKVENRDVDPLELPIGRVLLGRVRTTDGSRIPTPHFGFGLRRSVDDDLLLLLWTRRVDRPAVPSNLAGVRKDGVFQARPILQQGEYMVEVSLPLGYRIASMTYDGLDLMRVPLKGPLIAGAGIIDIVVAPPLAGATPGVKVSGRVRGLPGGLAEGWFVGIEATSTLTGGGGPIPVGPWGEAPVGSDGSFAFSPVPPGIYRVQALSKRVRSKVGQINVGDRDITNVEIRADDPEPSLAVP